MFLLQKLAKSKSINALYQKRNTLFVGLGYTPQLLQKDAQAFYSRRSPLPRLISPCQK
jgi:hypothetical protein